VNLATEKPEALLAFYAASPNVLRALATTLAQNNAAEQTVAGQALSAIGPAAVPVLRRALRTSESATGRAEAAESLGTLGPVAAEAAGDLKEALKDKPAAFNAAVALWRVAGDAGGVHILIEALAAGDPAVRAAAATALGDLNTKANVVAPLTRALADPEGNVRVAAVAALARVGAGANAVPALTAALADSNAGIRGAAVSTLGHLGKAAVPALAALGERARKDADPNIRRSACQAIANVVHTDKEHQVEAVPLILPCLEDRVKQVRRSVIGALSHLDRPTVNPVVLPRLVALIVADPEDDDGLSPEQYLYGAGAPALEKHLVPLLDHRRPEVRLAALRLIHEMGEIKVPIPALIKALKDENREVRQMGFTIIDRERQAAAPAVPVLIEKLQGMNAAERVDAAYALGWMGQVSQPAVPALLEAARSKDEALRTAALSTLAVLRPPAGDALPLYTAAAECGSAQQARVVLAPLAAFGKEGVPALTIALRHKDTEVRKRAAQWLGELKAGREALQEALKDGEPTVRAAAVQALAQVGLDEATTQAVLKRLDPATEPSAEVRAAIATALALAPRSAAGAALPLLRAAETKDRVEAVRRAAHETARRLGGP
jgi:HEAT repeat protein